MSYLIKLEDELLATLKPFESDNYWWECKIITTEKFSLIEPLMREALEAAEEDNFELSEEIWDKIYEMGVIMVSEDKQDLILNPFVVWLREDGTASMRY